MGSIDNVSIGLFVKGSLGAKLAAKEFGWIYIGMESETLAQTRGRCIQVGGRLSALATSEILGNTVLMPFPLPSILVRRTGMLQKR